MGRARRDSTASALADELGVTAKAVRDVWLLRTWAWTTMPYWAPGDLALFLDKHLCAACKARGVRALPDACQACAGPRRRGRPRKHDPEPLEDDAGLISVLNLEEEEAEEGKEAEHAKSTETVMHTEGSVGGSWLDEMHLRPAFFRVPSPQELLGGHGIQSAPADVSWDETVDPYATFLR